MNWAQENKKLAGIVGVMVVGGLGLGVWLYLSWSGYSGAMEQWDQTQSRINTIRSKKPTPTADNVAKREKHLSEYADKVNQLRGALLAVQQGTKPISETEFQARLKDISAEMKRQAKAAGVKDLPDDFALGFDKYSTQPPRSPEIAAELNVHLDAVQKLVVSCIEAGVTSIDMLERTKLENEDAPLPVKAPPVTTKPKAGAASAARKAKGAKKVVITEQAAAEPVLDRYPIKLLITTDQGPFQNLVNTLCHPGKMPYFMVLRLVRIENARTDGPTKDEIVQRRNSANQAASPDTAPKPAAEPPKPGAAPAAQLITPPRPATPDAFDIMGREQLKVYMEIDYIRFRPAPKIEEEETSTDTPAPAGAPAPAPAAAKS
jgi:hypothetical protein